MFVLPCNFLIGIPGMPAILSFEASRPAERLTLSAPASVCNHKTPWAGGSVQECNNQQELRNSDTMFLDFRLFGFLLTFLFALTSLLTVYLLFWGSDYLVNWNQQETIHIAC